MYFICSHNVVNHNFHCMAMCCCWMHLVLVFFLCVWICCAFYTFRNIMCSNVSAILFTCFRRCLSNAVKHTKNTWTAVICYFVFILPCHFRMAERNSFKRIEIEYSLHVILICHIIVIPLKSRHKILFYWKVMKTVDATQTRNRKIKLIGNRMLSLLHIKNACESK